MNKILVTGATGFIGNYVVERLVETGYHVVASSSSIESASQYSWFKKVEYIEFNIDKFCSQENYFHYFSAPDRLIHLAWKGLPNYNQPFHLVENRPANLQLISNLVQNGLRDVTVAGTCFEYGMQEGSLSESMAVSPQNYYARAKFGLYKDLQGLNSAFDFNLKWLRLFYMWGAGQNAKSLIPQLEKALIDGKSSFDMSPGDQLRDFLHVEEVAAKIIKASLQQDVLGVINVCSGEPQTVQMFVEKFLAQRGKSLKLNLGAYPYADYEPMHFWGCNDKFQTIK